MSKIVIKLVLRKTEYVQYGNMAHTLIILVWRRVLSECVCRAVSAKQPHLFGMMPFYLMFAGELQRASRRQDGINVLSPLLCVISSAAKAI